MLKLTLGQSVSVLFLNCAVFALSALAAQGPNPETCGISRSQPAERIFANTDRKQGWREYRSAKEVPELENDFGEFVQLWTSHDGNLLITIQAPGEDFASYTNYCFDSGGHLIQLTFQLRTAWGWGYRVEGFVSKGRFAQKTPEFFSTENEKPIPKPDQANSVPDALNPRIFMREAQLPFFKLLSKN
jgi:hypothetical protein